MRRRKAPEPPSPTGVPAALALGPCVEVWADEGCHFPEWSAWHNWKAARDEWARSQGLEPGKDYRHLPPELCDRAPFHSTER